MKRSIEPGPTEGAREKQYRRQDPVSCHFCRNKKLKCSREYPQCSNCLARKIDCSLADSHPIIKILSPSTDHLISNGQNFEELNSRIRKLEELLATKTSFGAITTPASSFNSAPPNYASTTPLPTRNPNPVKVELAKTVSWLKTDAFEHEPSFPNELSAPNLKVAENFGSFIFSLTRPRAPPSLDQNVAAMLPTRAQGVTLLDFYIKNINWIYHIIHIPTLRKRFDTLYQKLESNESPEMGPLAIVTTIFALSAYFSLPTSGLYFSHAEATSLFRRWTALAQHALSASDCLTSPTIESLQSSILISQLLMPSCGAIATLRSVAATTIQAARTLGLHTTDSPANRKRREHKQVDWVDIEVRRRIWWHIVSTDWLLSFMSGPETGTYMIQPNQMHVDWPSNVDDEAITYGLHPPHAQTLDIPTEMTYTTFRIQGSIYFREVADASWQDGCDTDNLPYEAVLAFDKKLNSLIADHEKAHLNLPNKHTGSALNPRMHGFIMQRHMAQFGVHTRFTRLHRPFLIPGAQDPRFAYSRMICLRSTRKVIESGKMILDLNKDISAIKIWSLNHHLFVSTVILVMDYCLNRDEPRAKEREQEIVDCFRVLESCQGESNIATTGLQKLKELLQNSSKDNTSGEEISPRGVRQSAAVFQQQEIPTNNFKETMNNWTDMDLSNINFDVDLDVSQFEELFTFNADHELF